MDNNGDNNARHIRWRISLSLSISFLGWWKKTYKKKIMCVCVRERERFWGILREKLQWGGKKQNKTRTKFNLRSRIKQRNNAGSWRSSRKKNLTEFSSIVVVVAAGRKKRKTVGVKGDEIRKRKTGVPQKRWTREVEEKAFHRKRGRRRVIAMSAQQQGWWWRREGWGLPWRGTSRGEEQANVCDFNQCVSLTTTTPMKWVSPFNPNHMLFWVFPPFQSWSPSSF